jgi:hypothetical protein
MVIIVKSSTTLSHGALSKLGTIVGDSTLDRDALQWESRRNTYRGVHPMAGMVDKAVLVHFLSLHDLIRHRTAAFYFSKRHTDGDKKHVRPCKRTSIEQHLRHGVMSVMHDGCLPQSKISSLMLQIQIESLEAGRTELRSW